MKLKMKDKPYGVVEFYDDVAKMMGNEDPSELAYDCRKINVAQNIQDGFYKHYTEYLKRECPSMSMNEIKTWITQFLLNYGPKVDKNLEPNTAEVFDGFIDN